MLTVVCRNMFCMYIQEAQLYPFNAALNSITVDGGVRLLYSGEAPLMRGVLIGEADRCCFPSPTGAPSRDTFRKQSVVTLETWKLIKLRISEASSRRLATQICRLCEVLTPVFCLCPLPRLYHFG